MTYAMFAFIHTKLNLNKYCECEYKKKISFYLTCNTKVIIFINIYSSYYIIIIMFQNTTTSKNQIINFS